MPGRRVVATQNDDEVGNSRVERLWNEDEVLQPASEEAHPDDWPCFVLRDAIVYKKDGLLLGNLLHAETDGPLIVRGSLEVDKDFRDLQIIRNLKGQQVEIKNVLSFSIAVGPVTIWALGKAGWFEIRPARVYRSIFDRMVEGVKLYYSLTDIYEGNKDQRKSLEMGKLFDQYAREFDMSMTPPQVAKLIEDHGRFLLSQMQKPAEPIRWSSTCVYRWLIDRCPVPQGKTSRTANKGRAASPKSEQNAEVKFLVADSSSTRIKTSIGRSRRTIDAESVASKRAILQPDGTVRPRQPAGLRLPSVSLNRDFTSEDESQSRRSRKRRRTSPSLESSEAELTDTGTLDQGSDEPEDEEEGNIELTLTSEPIPSSEPQGPNGLWTCYVKGCTYSVASADESEGKEKIRVHFLEHADELDAREQLVLQEARPHMPVNYLLEKLRSIGESVRLAEQETIGGRIVPKPIKKEMTL